MARKRITTQNQTMAHTPASARGKNARLTDEMASRDILDWLLNYPDPDEILKKAGLSRYSLKTAMYDDEVAQCIDTRFEAVISTPWRLEPNQTRANKALTEILEPCMENLIRGFLSSVLFGYSVVEVTYQNMGGRWSIKAASEKPLDWFTYNKDGWMFVDEGGIHHPLDPRKFIVTQRNPTFINPYGESLLSRVWWPVFFKKNGRNWWARFLERFGEPLLIGKTADQRKFIDDLTALGIAAGLPVLPTDSVDAVTVSQAGEFERFENVLCKSIQKLILGQTLTSDIGSSGSYAAAKVHDEVRDDKRRADIRLVTRSMQHLIDVLANLNGWQSPTFVMADDSGLEQERAERDALLVDKGIVKLSESYLLDRYDYKKGDIEIPQSEVTPGVIDTSDQQQMSVFSAKRDFTPDQQAIEDLADALPKFSPIKKAAIESAIRAATSPEDLERRLAVVLAEADLTEFSRVLEQALFAADVMGYANSGTGEPAQPQTPVSFTLPEINVTAPIHVAMPEQVAPIINAQFAQPEAPVINVNVPEQKTPVVTVETKAPDVHVHVPEQQVIVETKAPDVHVHHPKKATQTVERDINDDIIKTVTHYED